MSAIQAQTAENPTGRKWYWWAAFLVIVGLGLLPWPIKAMDSVDARTNRIQTVGQRALATGLWAEGPSWLHDYGHVEVVFRTAAGDPEDVVVPVDHVDELSGEYVTVQYDPDHPSHVIVVGNTANTSDDLVPVFLAGCVLILAGLVLAALTFRRRRRFRKGHPIEPSWDSSSSHGSDQTRRPIARDGEGWKRSADAASPSPGSGSSYGAKPLVTQSVEDGDGRAMAPYALREMEASLRMLADRHQDSDEFWALVDALRQGEPFCASNEFFWTDREVRSLFAQYMDLTEFWSLVDAICQAREGSR